MEIEIDNISYEQKKNVIKIEIGRKIDSAHRYNIFAKIIVYF